MNPEQIKSTVRTLVATFGGMIAGWFAAKGWFTADQVLAVITSETFIGIITSVAVGIWGLFVHTNKNAVAVVDAIAKQPNSPVQAIITTADAKGMELSNSIPGSTTIPAGTLQATNMSRAA